MAEGLPLEPAPGAPRKRPGGVKEVPLCPRPGERLRWCAHDLRLLNELRDPRKREALEAPHAAFLDRLAGERYITLEQAALLRQLARRARFRQRRPEGRAMALGGEL